MTTICLIRHGETDWNSSGKLQGRTDIPLNSKGILQAEQCCRFLSDSHWDVLISSPLKRAKQTAEIINEELKLPLVMMEDFIERSYGDAEGLERKERETIYPSGQYPNQEDRLSLNRRVMTGIHKINSLYNGKRILVVAHGAVINAILAELSNGEIGSRKTKLTNACISNIKYTQDSWLIQNYNQIEHISEIDN